jgi:hypothetical protein
LEAGSKVTTFEDEDDEASEYLEDVELGEKILRIF